MSKLKFRISVLNNQTRKRMYKKKTFFFKLFIKFLIKNSKIT